MVVPEVRNPVSVLDSFPNRFHDPLNSILTIAHDGTKEAVINLASNIVVRIFFTLIFPTLDSFSDQDNIFGIVIAPAFRVKNDEDVVPNTIDYPLS